MFDTRQLSQPSINFFAQSASANRSRAVDGREKRARDHFLAKLHLGSVFFNEIAKGRRIADVNQTEIRT